MNPIHENLSGAVPQNEFRWLDMERAYQFVECYAPYLVSGDLHAFMNAVFNARWHAATQDEPQQVPSRKNLDTAISLDDIFKDKDRLVLSRLTIKDLKLAGDGEKRFDQIIKNQLAQLRTTDDGRLFGYGTDGYGTYLPLHLLWPKHRKHWGIYISERMLMALAAQMYCGSQPPLLPDWKEFIKFLKIAFQIILRHELFHFKIEQWALVMELITGRPVYLPYLEYVYLPSLYAEEDTNLEEALANLSILLSRKIQDLAKEVHSNVSGNIERYFLACQGPGYRNYHLSKGFPKSLMGRTEEITYRNVVNYLCNQVARHELEPKEPLTPFFVYPPNNNFLRAENLVPIYLVHQIPLEASLISATG